MPPVYKCIELGIPLAARKSFKATCLLRIARRCVLQYVIQGQECFGPQKSKFLHQLFEREWYLNI